MLSIQLKEKIRSFLKNFLIFLTVNFQYICQNDRLCYFHIFIYRPCENRFHNIFILNENTFESIQFQISL